MCGIAGKLTLDGSAVADDLVRNMCDAIAHRGPDEWGSYCRGNVGIGNRRLSIIDLASGHQPISNEDETIWIVFNGEIYNFPELRESVIARGHTVKTRSDTEVIVHLYEDYGVDCLHHLNGMFAFAIWDEKRRRLFIARDRLGQKPLFYSLAGNALTFSSELNSLLQDADIPRRLDFQALDLYLRLLYVPGPWTMYQDVRKLLPAHYMLYEDGEVQIERYWDVQFTPSRALTEDDATAEIRALLEDSVRQRLIADVPLGAFLSGGVDSSTIVAMMTQLTGKPVKTFSIGFEEDLMGELPYAREVAQRYGTDHHELSVRPEMVDILPRLVRHYGEPFGDSSAVATYYVSKLASQSVKVVLSGDGGDEVFGGYPWYVSVLRPSGLAHSYVKDGSVAFRTAWSNRQFRPMLGALKGTIYGLSHAAQNWRDPKRAFEGYFTLFSPQQRQQLLAPGVRAELAAQQRATSRFLGDVLERQNGGNFLNQMFYADHHLYLPDDILVKVDIASMANSLEVRSPFIDYRLVELSATIPPEWKVKGTNTKCILRTAVADLIPESVLNRPKQGFGLPVDKWMREDLYEMANDLLLDSRSQSQSIFNQELIGTLLEQHKDGRYSHGDQLWLLLFFELWYREMFESVPVRP